jgi:translation initiation factor IF-3
MLIDNNGDKKGIVPLKEALKIARDIELDLVQVSSSDSKPIVCKILDYGKMVFEKKKKHIFFKC